MKVIAVLAVWLFVGICSIIVVLAFPLVWALSDLEPAQNMLRALDKVAATLFGFSGYYTLSAELGQDDAHPRARAFVDKLLGAGHCKRAAIREMSRGAPAP